MNKPALVEPADIVHLMHVCCGCHCLQALAQEAEDYKVNPVHVELAKKDHLT
jgi:hypothetical protein